MRHVSTLIVGAGQCGLAMSHELNRYGVDHLILERGQVANSWRTERWNSLKLLTPNWANSLPGFQRSGLDPDSFMSASELANRMNIVATRRGAPIQTDTSVLGVAWKNGRYTVDTTSGAISCDHLVAANGACGIPNVPKISDEFPSEIQQLTPHSYKQPEDLPMGRALVVGASASGLQLAREIQLSGRQVVLAVGNHLRLPRQYRGADILKWMDVIGATTVPYTEVDDIERVRRTPSLPLLGSNTAKIDLNALQDIGVEIVGRLAAVREGSALFSGSLANQCASADLKMNRLLATIDKWIDDASLTSLFPAAESFEPTRCPEAPRLKINFRQERFESVVWATGYRPDHRWLTLPVFDRKARIEHDGGVVGAGLYVLGLPYLRKRKSTFIGGASGDAQALARHLAAGLGARCAA